MTTTLIAAIAAFSTVILLLAILLLVAQSQLVQSGPVKIYINGDLDNPRVVAAGSTLLTTLSQESMFLPSACGGGGTCAMCKCKVTEGGGDVLPTEVGHLSRQEKNDHVRLSCQVKVKNDMHIEIPEEIFGIKKWECEVVSNYNVATYIKEFVVKLPEGEDVAFEPGGYIQIDVPEITVDYGNIDITSHPRLGKKPDEFQAEWDQFRMWDLKMVNDEAQFRAYSMANHPAEKGLIMLNIRVATPPFDMVDMMDAETGKPVIDQRTGRPRKTFFVPKKDGSGNVVKNAEGKPEMEFNGFQDINPGVCSSYIFDLKPGDKVMISGPYGEFHINETEREMIYIGGGAGMAPLRSHLLHLFQTLKTGRKVSYWYGGRAPRELFYIEDFRNIEKEFPNFKFHVCIDRPHPDWKEKQDLDDEGDGFVGYVAPKLEELYLAKHPEPEEVEYYFCGPPGMNASVVNLLDKYGIPDENIRFDDFGE